MSRPRTLDDDAMLDAALDLFWSRGYDGVSIADLEAHVGVGRQTLYNAFGDKRALFRLALARYADRAAHMRSDFLAPGNGLSGIRNYFDALVAFCAAEARGRGCLLVGSQWREAAADRDVAAQCRRSETTLLRQLQAALAVARDGGELPRDFDVDAAARALVAHQYGLAVLAAGGAGRAELATATRWMLDRLG